MNPPRFPPPLQSKARRLLCGLGLSVALLAAHPSALASGPPPQDPCLISALDAQGREVNQVRLPATGSLTVPISFRLWWPGAEPTLSYAAAYLRTLYLGVIDPTGRLRLWRRSALASGGFAITLSETVGPTATQVFAGDGPFAATPATLGVGSTLSLPLSSDSPAGLYTLLCITTANDAPVADPRLWSTNSARWLVVSPP